MFTQSDKGFWSDAQKTINNSIDADAKWERKHKRIRAQIQKEYNNEMFIIWVEGLSLKTGEKVKDFTDTGVSYTTKMTEAIRVKRIDLFSVESYLNRHGISYTLHETTYAPYGTLLDLKRIAL